MSSSISRAELAFCEWVVGEVTAGIQCELSNGAHEGGFILPKKDVRRYLRLYRPEKRLRTDGELARTAGAWVWTRLNSFGLCETGKHAFTAMPEYAHDWFLVIEWAAPKCMWK